jgi:hypothetical protein
VIPAIESEYRVRPGAGSRFLVGIGAGGYAAINLLIDHPDFFSGVWALSPDAISFEDFLGMNFWSKRPFNAFLKDSKQPRPMVEDPETGRTILTVRAQSELETILGPGNKLSGYESAFSPASGFSEPAPLFNRRTGKLIQSTLNRWRKFDLAKKLAGLPEAQRLAVGRLIHIRAGKLDPYGMVRSTMAFKASTDALGLSIDIVINEKATRKDTCESRSVHEAVQLAITRAHRSAR